MAGRLRSLYLAYFSKPKGFRPLYRLLRKRPIRRIVELGIGDASRTLRMLELCPPSDETSFTGIDLFEMRGNGDAAGVTLKQAHRLLAAVGCRVRLIPGDPYTALSRSANALGRRDLILISSDQDRDSLARAWFYVPRMLHESTVVLLEEIVDGQPTLRTMPHDEIARLANPGKGRRAA